MGRHYIIMTTLSINKEYKIKTITVSIIVEIPDEYDVVETIDSIISDIENVGQVVRLHVSDDDQDYIDR